jgi:hypothetical protein
MGDHSSLSLARKPCLVATGFPRDPLHLALWNVDGRVIVWFTGVGKMFGLYGDSTFSSGESARVYPCPHCRPLHGSWFCSLLLPYWAMTYPKVFKVECRSHWALPGSLRFSPSSVFTTTELDGRPKSKTNDCRHFL